MMVSPQHISYPPPDFSYLKLGGQSVAVCVSTMWKLRKNKLILSQSVQARCLRSSKYIRGMH